jgi:hypothetical protein
MLAAIGERHPRLARDRQRIERRDRRGDAMPHHAHLALRVVDVIEIDVRHAQHGIVPDREEQEQPSGCCRQLEVSAQPAMRDHPAQSHAHRTESDPFRVDDRGHRAPIRVCDRYTVCTAELDAGEPLPDRRAGARIQHGGARDPVLHPRHRERFRKPRHARARRVGHVRALREMPAEGGRERCRRRNHRGDRPERARPREGEPQPRCLEIQRNGPFLTPGHPGPLLTPGHPGERTRVGPSGHDT